MQLSETFSRRPGYPGLEFDFLRYLAKCESAGWMRGDEKEAQEKTQAYRSFFLEYMEVWGNHFCEEAKKEAETLSFQEQLKITQGVTGGHFDGSSP